MRRYPYHRESPARPPDCPWSKRFLRASILALCLAATVAAAQHVVISELMYHPVDGLSGTNTVDGDEFEFLELFNAGASPATLTSARFSEGIAYTFTNATTLAASNYLVLACNRAAFTNRYPGVANLAAGAYSGRLNNNGERVTLVDGGGSALFSVSYGTRAAWSRRADGHGASLVLLNPDGEPDAPAQWGPSDRFGGTPGIYGTCASNDVCVNEVLAHTDPPFEDAIELWNATTTSIAVGGWYLSDDPVQRAKYRITNATIQARGFLVFYQWQFADTNTPGNTPFSFSELGDTAYLTAADAASNLTRFVGFARFDGTERNASVGLFPDGVGEVTPLATPTFGISNPAGVGAFRTGAGASNSPPLVGPVVISEIMYNPANDHQDLEYIELLNVSTGTIALFDMAVPTNTWALTTAVDFMLPTNLTLAAGQRMLLCGATNLAVFRSAYGLSPDVAVAAAWSGRLNNAGDTVKLLRPGAPETNAVVPYILVEQVDYDDAAPWPTAPDGHGPSLERLSPTNYGNTAANWFAGPPGGTPGGGPAAGLLNPTLNPPSPASGQAFTVSVSVVAATLPTQVVAIVAGSGGTNTWILHDDGAGGDPVAGDQVYSAFVPGQFTNTWVYYRFAACGQSNSVVQLPAPGVSFIDAPPIRLQIAYEGVIAIVTPTDVWQSYSVSGTVTHVTLFDVFMTASGEALVDDISIVDTATQTEHIASGSFDAPIAGLWKTNGNHSSSFREQLPGENGNGVLHVVAGGAGTGYTASVNVDMSPPLTLGELATLTFRTRRASVEVPAWLWTNIGLPPADPVINEIMYHPAETNEADFEFVELFNPADTPVDLSGCRLDGVALQFPSGTVLPPFGFAVCGASTATLVQACGVTNPIGNWGGHLQNDGETVRLVNAFGRELDIVSYGDNLPWAPSADGFGPSLERINPAAAGTHALHWAGSGSDTNWFYLSWTGAIASANTGIAFYLDYAGKCWVDDVSVKPLGGGAEIVSNGLFEAGTNDWTASGNHGCSRVEAGAGRGGTKALAVAGTFSRYLSETPPVQELICHGDAVSNAVQSLQLDSADGTTYVFSCWVRRDGLADHLFYAVGDATNGVWLGSRGTPGATNSAFHPATPFGISRVLASSNVVDLASANIVRATVSPRTLTNGVSLGYRVVESNTYEYTDWDYTWLSMRDDGVAPDSLADDGEYAAAIPAVQTNGSLVRFCVQAAATNGMTARYPPMDDPSRDLGYWVFHSSPQTHLPNWHLMADGDPILYPVASRGCAVSPDGQVLTDIILRHRGSPTTNFDSAVRSGLALRAHRTRLLDTWFAPAQEGINFRSRRNSGYFQTRRLVNECLTYDLQRLTGLAAPRIRYVCVWINGDPSITTELEDPEDDFLTGNGLDANDYAARSSRSGWRRIAGDPALDNFWQVVYLLTNAAGPAKQDIVLTNLVYEKIQQSLALLALGANSDQNFLWNMIEHRYALDGRWDQYPWDVDSSFVANEPYDPRFEPDPASTNLHPYYDTPLHPDLSSGDTNGRPFYSVLFYPETGPEADYTLPYRYRHQMTLWRLYSTLFTTNVLYPRLDNIVQTLTPAYAQIGKTDTLLTNRVQSVKDFIAARRSFLMDGTWSDKDTNIWQAVRVYDPTRIVINELMIDPGGGGEYVELFNGATQSVDLGWWELQAGNESYRLPHGTMIGPTSYLVIADSQVAMTNAYVELSPSGNMVRRCVGTPLWDWPVVWTSATEYITRVVEEPGLTLPNGGALLLLRDIMGNIIDSTPYTNLPPWPAISSRSMELIDPSSNNAAGASWRLSTLVGTPGYPNSAMLDQDEDSLPDAWEMAIVGASGGAFTHVGQVLPDADFDHDGMSNAGEFTLGSDPTTNDAVLAGLWIASSNHAVVVGSRTIALAGSAYQGYTNRFYTILSAPLLSGTTEWMPVPGYDGIPASGGDITLTNPPANTSGYYRSAIWLAPLRP